MNEGIYNIYKVEILDTKVKLLKMYFTLLKLIHILDKKEFNPFFDFGEQQKFVYSCSSFFF